MTNAVIEVFLGDDGIWIADVRPVFGSDDLTTIESLEGVPTEHADVRVAGAIKRITVYRLEDCAYVTWQDALG